MKTLGVALTILLACDFGLFSGAYSAGCVSTIKAQLAHVTDYANARTRMP